MLYLFVALAFILFILALIPEFLTHIKYKKLEKKNILNYEKTFSYNAITKIASYKYYDYIEKRVFIKSLKLHDVVKTTWGYSVLITENDVRVYADYELYDLIKDHGV